MAEINRSYESVDVCMYASDDISAPNLQFIFSVPAYSTKDYLKKFKI